MADTTCSRGHSIGDGATTPGPHNAANVYRYRDGRRGCLRCTRAQWRRQWARKAARRG